MIWKKRGGGDASLAVTSAAAPTRSRADPHTHHHAVAVLLLAGDADRVTTRTVGGELRGVVGAHDARDGDQGTQGLAVLIAAKTPGCSATLHADSQGVVVIVGQVLVERSAFVDVAVKGRLAVPGKSAHRRHRAPTRKKGRLNALYATVSWVVKVLMLEAVEEGLADKGVL